MGYEMPDYQRILQRSVNYIESRLQEDLVLEEIAEHAGFSLYHFMHVFAIFTGYTLKGYIRQRRLSEAAKTLLTGEDYINELTRKFGFTSVEAFIRAFKKQFNITPQEYRKKNQLIDYIPKMRVQICLQNQGGFMVKYQVREMPALTIIGRRGLVKHSETAVTIDRMLAEFKELNKAQHFTEEKTVIGVCLYDDRFFDMEPGPDDEWYYLVGYLAKADEAVPAGFERHDVAPLRYAVFTHQGNLSNLCNTYRYICTDWISSVDYEWYPADELDFYDERYNAADAENSEYDLYIAIK
jgi:AraC family transcriptional regulator